MRIGALTSRVVIRQPSTTQDTSGQPLTTFSDVATVWANIRHVSGSETIRGAADVSVVRVSIRIRYKTGLTAGMRVVHGTSNYDIKAVLMDVENKDFTDLVCELVV